MKKIIYFFAFLFISFAIFYSCDDQNLVLENPFEGTDYEMLAISDDQALNKFLSTHYYDENTDALRSIENDEISLLNSEALETQTITTTIDDKIINFKLYTYIIEEGEGNVKHNTINKGKPTNIDSLLISYSSRILIAETTSTTNGVESIVGNFLEAFDFENVPLSWSASDILGRSYGLTLFKPGANNTSNGEKLNFSNTGKGYVFMPSGLAYPSINFNPRNRSEAENPPPRFDAIIVSKIELFDFVPNTDHDNDGTPSILEDSNCDGNPRNDSNDKFFPGLPDYLNSNFSQAFNCN